MLLLKDSLNISLVGNKAYNLCKAGIKNTPPFFVCPTYVCCDILKYENELKEEINRLFSNKKDYAIRSSGVDEDSADTSFAGIHDTCLFVKKENILDRIKDVINSKESKRAIDYRLNNNLETNNIKIAVIIEEMIDSDYAGVINTINPLTNNPDEIVISVVRGIGEALVSGEKDSTDYFISGKKRRVNGEDILNNKQINNLLKLAKEISIKYDRFQDIEFAIKRNKVYFLQTRDIVTYKNINNKKRLFTIDNSNIIESYYGITLPLTASFAKSVYESVYTSTFRVGRVRESIIDSLASSLANMLYYHEGKIYYNMNSWYQTTSIFPSSKSTSYMEDMMGVASSSKSFKKAKMNIIDLLKVGVILLNKLTKIDKLSNEFEKKFNEYCKDYYGKSLSGDTLELIEAYKNIERVMVPLFTTPIINDIAVMFYFGSLKAKVNKLKVGNKEEILNNAISNGGNVISTGSALELIKIKEYINNDIDLCDDFNNLDYLSLYNKYHNSDLEISKMIKEYIYNFGSRVKEELKLETVTMIENNALIYKELKENIKNIEIAKSDVIIPKSIKKKAKKAKKFIQNRERLRLKRTYIFSVIRNIFLAIGNNFYEENKISDKFDIFYLTKDEIFENRSDYKELVALRKKEIDSYKKLPIYDRVVFYEDGILNVLGGSDLKGIGNGYKITGKAYILDDINESFPPDSIIITKRTDPGWISIFPKIKGLVVEHGSMLSHSFVVAREMGIPALVGIKDATKTIKNGDIITIDGVKGEVLFNE